MQFVPFEKMTLDQHTAAAEILVSAFSHMPSAWSTKRETEEEIALFLEDEDYQGWAGIDDGRVLGWIGAIKHHDLAWELHPLCVDPTLQGQGLGRELVQKLEQTARDADIVSIWLGTDDDFGGTSIFGKDLYPDPLSALKDLKTATGHPYQFYKKLGYVVTGVLPDVNGLGKHDILMAKRIRP